MAPSSTLYDRLRQKLVSDRVFLLASAVTFNVIVTVIPILLIVVSGLGGLIESSGTIRSHVLDYLDRTTPLSETNARELLGELVEDRGWLGTIGFVALAWTSTRLFTSLRDVLEIVFEIPFEGRLGLVEGKIHDIKMVLVVGVLFLLTVSVTSLFGWAGERGARALGLPSFGLGWVVDVTAVLLGGMVTFAMFYFLYRHVPDRRIGRFDAVMGGLFSAVLFELAKQAFAIYLLRFGRSIELYGSLGGLVAGVLWIYYSSVVFLVGAEIASARRWARGTGASDAVSLRSNGSAVSAESS